MDTIAPMFESGMEYIKQLNPMNTTVFKTVTSFLPGQAKDPSNNATQALAGNETFDDAPPESDGSFSGNIMAFVNNPSYSNAGIVAMMLLYYALILILASFIANEYIGSPPAIRLFGFSFFLILALNTQIVVVPIAIYYIICGLYKAYLNYRDKPAIPHSLIPEHYAFLPLMTSRGDAFDFLNPFVYFTAGPDMNQPTYFFYDKYIKEYKLYLESLVPDIYELKKRAVFKIPELISKFNTFIDDINKSFYTPNGVTQPIGPKGMEEDPEVLKRRRKVEGQITGAILQETGPDMKTFVTTLAPPTNPPTTSTGLKKEP